MAALINFSELPSTQDKAFELAAAGAAEWTVVVAEQQTAGRGQFQRPWFSKKGGLWMSVILRPPQPLVEPGMLSLLAGVAVAETLQELGISPTLKWPNDVLVNGKKIAGVLIEVKTVGARHAVPVLVMGIGLNVDFVAEDFPEELRDKATSLRAVLASFYAKGSHPNETNYMGSMDALTQTVLLQLTQGYNAYLANKYSLIQSSWQRYNVETANVKP